MTERVDLEAFVSGFVAEAEDHLRTCRNAAMELDRAAQENVPRPRAVRDLYRALHTMKGLAAMVGIETLVDLLHRMEAVMRDAEQAGGILTSEALDVMVRALEALEVRVHEVARGERAKPAPERLLAELANVHTAPSTERTLRGVRLDLDEESRAKLTTAEHNQIVEGVRAGKRALRLLFVPSNAKLEAGLNITSVRERIAELAEIVRVLPITIPRTDEAPGGLAFMLLVLTDAEDVRLAEVLGGEPAMLEPLVAIVETLEDEHPEPTETAVSGNFVRVSVDRLDRALIRLSTVVVTRSRLDRAIDALQARGVDVRSIRHAAADHARDVRDLREAILQLRMIPLAEMLEPIPLILRGLRTTTGKTVRFEMNVARSELDKAVAETVFPAVVHLVRNSVDHGIEPPARRLELGKPEVGLLTVQSAALGTGMLELVIEDDGKGIDTAAVARRANVPIPETDEGLLALLVRPGLSTRGEADHMSGRGMGLDIVHRIVVQKLGGELHLQNRPGVGASFTLRIPLTVAIVDGLTFRCADQSFVVPLSTVDGVLDLGTTQILTGPDPDHTGRAARMIEYHGQIVPFVSLRELIGEEDLPKQTEKGVVVRRSGRAYAFGIDRLLGMQEVVVRPLEDPLVRVPGIAGSTDLGDGRPTLVLDLPALVAREAGAPEAA